MKLIEKMERKSAPKSWIAEIRRMLAELDKLAQGKEEYGLIIENQATENALITRAVEQMGRERIAYQALFEAVDNVNAIPEPEDDVLELIGGQHD